MEILLASSVLAALITTLVNLWIAERNSKSAKSLEMFKQSLASEIKASELSYSKLDTLREYVLNNNISTLAMSMKQGDPKEFSDLCTQRVPNLMIEYSAKVEACYIYLKNDRIKKIDDAAKAVRDQMKILIALSEQGSINEAAAKMLKLFAEYNQIVEKELNDALSTKLEIAKL